MSSSAGSSGSGSISTLSESSGTETITGADAGIAFFNTRKQIKYKSWKKAVAYHKAKYQRKEFARELPIYLLFLTSLCLVIFIGWDVTNSANTAKALNGIILEGEFPKTSTEIYKDYYSIGDFSDFWDFMEGPFFDGISVTQTPAGVNLPTTDERYVGVWNKLVGPIRLRQKRVKSGPCRLQTTTNANYDNTCYPTYHNDDQESAAYGPGTTGFNFTGTEESGTYDWTGVLSNINYDAAGYIIDLPLDEAGAKAAVAALKAGNWLDLKTRAVFGNLNFVNPSLELYTSMQFLIEFLPSGHVHNADVKIRSFRVDLFLRPGYTFRTICEGFMCIFILYYLYKYLHQVYDDVRAYPGDLMKGFKEHIFNLWNILDLVNMALFVAVIVLRIMWYTNLNRQDLADGIPLKSDKFTHFETLANDIYAWTHLLSLNVLFAFLKSFKFLQISGKLSLMWTVIMKAAPDLAAYTFIFFIIVLGFVTTGYILFGPTLDAFRTYEKSFNTLLLFILGAFEYSELRIVDQYYAPIYFYLFMLIVFFILINMFLAIINDAYVVVNEDVDTEAESEALKAALKTLVAHTKAFFKKVPSDTQQVKKFMKERFSPKHGISDRVLFERISRSDLFKRKEAEGRSAMITLEECQKELGKGVSEDRAIRIWTAYKDSKKAADSDSAAKPVGARFQNQQYALIVDEFSNNKKDLDVIRANLETLRDEIDGSD